MLFPSRSFLRARERGVMSGGRERRSCRVSLSRGVAQPRPFWGIGPAVPKVTYLLYLRAETESEYDPEESTFGAETSPELPITAEKYRKKMVAIALAFGALTLGAPTQKAAASLAQKNPTKSGINLAAPFWGNDNGSSGDFTNDGVDCSATRVASGDANKIKDTMKKLTARPRCSAQGGDVCDPAVRQLGFDCMDKDGSGTVTTKEVEDMMEADGAPKEAAAMIVGIFDENGDGTITAKEFNDAMVCMMSDMHDMCAEHSSDTSQCPKACTSK